MSNELDFDHLKNLFKQDPFAAQKLADEMVETAINGMDITEDKKQRLKAANFSLQQDLRKYKHPIARLQRMEFLFWEQFNRFQTAMETPSLLMEKKTPKFQTNVVPFRKPRSAVDTE